MRSFFSRMSLSNGYLPGSFLKDFNFSLVYFRLWRLGLGVTHNHRSQPHFTPYEWDIPSHWYFWVSEFFSDIQSMPIPLGISWNGEWSKTMDTAGTLQQIIEVTPWRLVSRRWTIPMKNRNAYLFERNATEIIIKKRDYGRDSNWFTANWLFLWNAFMMFIIFPSYAHHTQSLSNFYDPIMM